VNLDIPSVRISKTTFPLLFHLGQGDMRLMQVSGCCIFNSKVNARISVMWWNIFLFRLSKNLILAFCVYGFIKGLKRKRSYCLWLIFDFLQFHSVKFYNTAYPYFLDTYFKQRASVILVVFAWKLFRYWIFLTNYHRVNPNTDCNPSANNGIWGKYSQESLGKNRHFSPIHLPQFVKSNCICIIFATIHYNWAFDATI